MLFIVIMLKVPNDFQKTISFLSKATGKQDYLVVQFLYFV